ncbi:MAG: hypothetical protein U5L11_10730 [Arhodomonas sp.]|nr:hypothetical protein [Arhodomonas sp.]
MEALRYALDRTHKGQEARKHGDQVLKENLGRAQARIRLELVSAEQRLNSYTVVRRYGEPPGSWTPGATNRTCIQTTFSLGWSSMARTRSMSWRGIRMRGCGSWIASSPTGTRRST